MRQAVYTIHDPAGHVMRHGVLKSDEPFDPANYDLRDGDTFAIEMIDVEDAPVASVEARLADIELRLGIHAEQISALMEMHRQPIPPEHGGT
jgi:hypothetical protein